MATTAQRREAIVAPIVAELGLELFDLEFTGGNLRVTVDVADPASATGIDLGDLTAVTRAVSRALDEHDPIPDRYSLEVSSPGLERTLRTPRHFERAVGQQVAIKTVPEAGTDRRLAGELVRADGTSIDVRLDGGDVRTVPYADIAKARTVFEWGPEPRSKAKQPKPSSTKPKQKKVKTT
jgi:ribosome maturation factor RimP